MNACMPLLYILPSGELVWLAGPADWLSQRAARSGGEGVNSLGHRLKGVFDPPQRIISASSYQYTATCLKYGLQYLVDVRYGLRPG